MLKYLFTLIATLFLVGCGGGAGSSGGGIGGTSLFSGIFIDAKVQGLDYNCSSGMSGTTDMEGTFTCKSGDTISFYARGVFLGTTSIASVISPYSLTLDNNIAVNIAQLLQTLDSDIRNEFIAIGGLALNLEEVSSVNFDNNLSATFGAIVSNIDAQNSMNINLALNDIEFNNIKGLNKQEQNIIANLNLPTSKDHGVTISWDSNNTTYIANDGNITKKSTCTDPDVPVKLTATLRSGTMSVDKVFTLTIKAVQGSDGDCDFIPDDIENMLGLDSSNGDENSNGIADGIDSDFNLGDTFYKNQWHLNARGDAVNNTNGVSTILGNDLDLADVYKQYMGYNGGSPIRVSVVDNGTDADHEDLSANMDMTRSRNAVNKSNDPSPTGDEVHGTMVAGIIAARGFNGKGVRGVAPFAKIVGNNWLSNQTYEELEKAWVTGEGANEIAVCNNSWGSDYDNDTIMESLLKIGATTLRDNKGRVYVKAAGNSRYDRGNSNLSNSSNNQYIIAVAALKHDNTHASYSSYGSNILVSGYSGEFYDEAPTIGTTTVAGDRQLPTWGDDTNHNYTYAMNGTSAASPTVSGSIALILEACPDLTYRDVKYIIAKTAKKVDSSNSTWVKNSANLWHSVDYGYGLINTKSAINMCKNGYSNISVEKSEVKTITPNTQIPDDDNIGVSFNIPISGNFKVEWVGVYPSITHTYQGDLELILTSPSGTSTQLVQEDNVLRSANNHYNGNGRLGSNAFVDENSSGDWVLTVKDKVALDDGIIDSIKLEVAGY